MGLSIELALERTSQNTEYIEGELSPVYVWVSVGLVVGLSIGKGRVVVHHPRSIGESDHLSVGRVLNSLLSLSIMAN